MEANADTFLPSTDATIHSKKKPMPPVRGFRSRYSLEAVENVTLPTDEFVDVVTVSVGPPFWNNTQVRSMVALG